MTTIIDELLAQDPTAWIQSLPEYQRDSINSLVEQGRSYDEVAQSWLSVSTANTVGFGTTPPNERDPIFLSKLKAEIRAFLCGDSKYKKEREGLFGEKSITRTYLVTAIAVTLAPHIGIAVSALVPVVALIMASFGKITLNAWCATGSSPQSLTE